MAALTCTRWRDVGLDKALQSEYDFDKVFGRARNDGRERREKYNLFDKSPRSYDIILILTIHKSREKTRSLPLEFCVLSPVHALSTGERVCKARCRGGIGHVLPRGDAGAPPQARLEHRHHPLGRPVEARGRRCFRVARGRRLSRRRRARRARSSPAWPRAPLHLP
jgi:hypothetical protein